MLHKIITFSPAYLLFAVALTMAANSDEQNISDSIKPALIADAHIHHGWSFEDSKPKLLNFDYFSQRDVQIMSFPMPVQRQRTDDLISVIENEIVDLTALSQKSNEFRIADFSFKPGGDLNSGPVTVFLSIEYFYGVFQGNSDNVKKYREMGIRSITLVDNDIDDFFTDDHLTKFGEQTIHQMNEAGILVDISHLSENHQIEAIRFSTDPVIASHSCAKAVSGNTGSLSDEVLEALRENEGYVFTTFNRNDLFMEGEAEADGMERFIDHVIYLANKLGAHKVGIGSDYQALGKYVPEALNQVSSYRQIGQGLRAAGFTDSEIGMITSGAFLHAMDVNNFD